MRKLVLGLAVSTLAFAGYNRRLHDAVANVLTGPQLASFEQMQKEALDQSQVWNRQRRDDAALTSN